MSICADGGFSDAESSTGLVEQDIAAGDLGEFVGRHNLDLGHLQLLKQCSGRVLAQVLRQDFTAYDVLDRQEAAIEYARQTALDCWDIDGPEMIDAFCRRWRLQFDVAAQLRKELTSEAQVSIVLPVRPWSGRDSSVRIAIAKRVAAGAAPRRNTRTQRSAKKDERFIGRISATGSRYCIIRCKETFARFKKDVFCKFSENPTVEGMIVDTIVEFSVPVDPETGVPRAQSTIEHAGRNLFERGVIARQGLADELQDFQARADALRRSPCRARGRHSKTEVRSRSRDSYRDRVANSAVSAAVSVYRASSLPKCSRGVGKRLRSNSTSASYSSAARVPSPPPSHTQGHRTGSDSPTSSAQESQFCANAEGSLSEIPQQDVFLRPRSQGVPRPSEDTGMVLELRGFDALSECTASSRGLAHTLAEIFEPTLAILPDFIPGQGPAIKCSWPSKAGHVCLELQSAVLCRSARLVIDGLAVLGKTVEAVVL